MRGIMYMMQVNIMDGVNSTMMHSLDDSPIIHCSDETNNVCVPIYIKLRQTTLMGLSRNHYNEMSKRGDWAET